MLKILSWLKIILSFTNNLSYTLALYNKNYNASEIAQIEHFLYFISSLNFYPNLYNTNTIIQGIHLHFLPQNFYHFLTDHLPDSTVHLLW